MNSKIREKLEKSWAPIFFPRCLSRTSKLMFLYRAKAQDGNSKLTLLLNLCKEALAILETRPGMLESEEIRVVKRFLSEQSTTEAQNRKLISKKEIPSGSLQSAYDEDAIFRRKGDVSQNGYVLEISETCGKENTFQLITDHAVEPNIQVMRKSCRAG